MQITKCFNAVLNGTEVNDKWRCHRKLKIVIFLLITIIMPAKQLQPKTCPCLVSWYSRLVAFFFCSFFTWLNCFLIISADEM